MSTKQIFTLAGVVLLLGVLVLGNPFEWNKNGYRTVVTRMNGTQFVQFKPEIYYAGFFSRSTEWPNQITVSYRDSTRDNNSDIKLEDNTVEIGVIPVRFNDATTADVYGITQYVLPVSEKEMIEIHNNHKTPEALVNRRLGPYTVECLGNAAQLMSSEMHYSGGKAQMTQDYLDQLQNGAFLLRIQPIALYDSTEKTIKRTYQVEVRTDKNGTNMRKFSSIKEYGIQVADAQITFTDYDGAVDKMLSRKIASATEASVSRQRLMTAQQQKLTAEAEGEKKLVEIEYIQKQEQTKQVVAAQTQVELAKQDLAKQEIARQAAEKEAAKIKVLADAQAYERQRVMAADGALDKKLATYERVQARWAEAFQNYNGAIVPQISYGTGSSTGSGNAATNFMEAMGAKAQRDLLLDMKATK
jgi:SPFH domain / Band 7 family